jgi:putative FmdB family regulatory protein
LPVYEYRCDGCGQRVEILVMSPEKEIRCPNCQGSSLQRLMSSFACHRSEADRLAAIDTSRPQGNDYYRDERNIGLWAKKRLKELGQEPGPEFEGMIEKAKKKVAEDLKG